MIELENGIICTGDCVDILRGMDSDFVNTCVTSPPYFNVRDYGVDGQIGHEESIYAYVEALVEVFREVRRVLRDDGTLWVNLGDSYAANRSYQVPSTKGGKKHSITQAAGGRGSRVPEGLKAKDMLMLPARLALALQADGWYLRQDIIWHSPNKMPERVTDRCVSAHEHIFLLSKRQKYYFDYEAIQEDDANGGLRRKRSVWAVNSAAYKGIHGAVFPPKLIEPCILAGAPEGGVVLDPFFGSGTTGLVAQELKRSFIGIELNPEYVELAKNRLEIGD